MSYEQQGFETVGSSIVGRVIRVSTEKKDEWLKQLNVRTDINAIPIERAWIKKGEETLVDSTYLLVSVSVDYDHRDKVVPRNPVEILQSIDRALRRVRFDLSTPT